jgi:integrase
MPIITLMLDKRGLKKEKAIYFSIDHCQDYKRQHVKIYLKGVKINPLDWNPDEGRVKGKSMYAIAINDRITSEKARIEKALADAQIDSIRGGSQISLLEIKEKLYGKIKVKESLKEESLLDLIDLYIAKKTIGDQYIADLTSLKNQLREFAKLYNYKLLPEELSYDCYPNRVMLDDLLDYFSEDKALSNNSVAIKISYLKGALNFCSSTLRRKLPEDYKHLKVNKSDAERERLTLEEFIRLKNMDFSYDEQLEQIRDVYVFACLVGRRSVEFKNLTPENLIIEDEVEKLLFYPAKKKGAKKAVKLYLPKSALEIIKKYSGKQDGLLPLHYSRTMNSILLRRVMEKAGFTSTVKRSVGVGDKIIEKRYKRYELLTMHTARHTYASILDNKGVSFSYIQNLLQHSSRATTEIYAKADNREANMAALEIFDAL